MTDTERGGTMTAEEWIKYLSADKARLTADLREYRNACEQKQEQIDSAKDVIKSLTADLAKARGRCEVCGWRWHWDFDYEQGTGEVGS